MPKVSIIVPIYNVERYLDRCVQSLLNQTLKDIEIILVDDGSPDNCPTLCNEYARKDSRIKVIHKKNAGLGFARNSGLDIANGEYIAFVDSDDYVSENMYEQLYNETVAQNFDIVYCGVNAQKRNGKIIREHVTDRIITKDEIITVLGNMIACDVHSKQERSEPMSVWHAIYKTEIIDRYHIRFMSEREILSEDILFDIQLLPHCKNIRFISQALYHYCYNNTSLTQTFSEDKLSRNLALLQEMIFILQKQGLAHLEQRALRFFIGYNRVFLKNILLSHYGYKKKKALCHELYNNKGWNIIFLKYPISQMSLPHRFILLTIKHKLFHINFIIYKLLHYFQK